jgi:hypothetical protein
MMVPFGLALSIRRWARPFRAPSVTAVVVLILLINTFSAFGDRSRNLPDYQAFAGFLEEKGLTKGYADYFVAYSLVYLSNERLVYSPAFHTPDADRYPPYTTLVSNADNPAFVFDRAQEADLFRQRLKALNTSYKDAVWEKFTVFYDLSPTPDLKNPAMGL